MMRTGAVHEVLSARAEGAVIAQTARNMTRDQYRMTFKAPLVVTDNYSMVIDIDVTATEPAAQSPHDSRNGNRNSSA